MKISLLSNTMEPILNGITVATRNLAAGLRKKGFSAKIFAPAYPGYVDSDEQTYRFCSLGPKSIDYRYPAACLTPKSVLEELRASELIHTMHTFFMGDIGAEFARKSGIPLVTTIHTQAHLYGSYVPVLGRFWHVWMPRWIKQYCGKCDAVITPGARMKPTLESFGVDPEKIFVIPNGIFAEEYAIVEDKLNEIIEGIAANGLGICDYSNVLIFVGRLSSEKRVEELVDLFCQASYALNKQEKHTCLLLIGEGKDRKRLEEKVQHYYQNPHVKFLGKVPHEQIKYYLSLATYYISLADTEVDPMTYKEAMICGLPVIATDVPGNEIVMHGCNGFFIDHLVRDKNSAGLPCNFSGALIDICSQHRDYAIMSGNARKTILKEHTIDRTVEKTIELYNSLK